MKKLLSIFFPLLISASAFAQVKNDSLYQKESKWAISVAATVNYLFPDFFTSSDKIKFIILPAPKALFAFDIKNKLNVFTGISLDYLSSKGVYKGQLISGASSRTFSSNYSFLGFSIGLKKRHC